MNKQAGGLGQMKYYRDNSITKHGVGPRHADIEFNGQIAVGKFVDIDRPYLPTSQEE